VLTARKAHVGSILIFSGKEKPRNRSSWEADPDHCARNLHAAVKIILQKNLKRTR